MTVGAQSPSHVTGVRDPRDPNADRFTHVPAEALTAQRDGVAPRYRFGAFVLSPRQRTLLRAGQTTVLIPRYFDLLLFLIERRNDAVHRRDIFDRVWADVIVSDSALSQAIRTLRRTLGDDSREPQFIRTVSRHGYQFVGAAVIEEADDGAVPLIAQTPDPAVPPPAAEPFAPLIALLTAPAGGLGATEDQRDAAERLHLLGTEQALHHLEGHPREAFGRALLADTRHLVATSGPVPLIGHAHGSSAVLALARIRLRRAAYLVAVRWLGAAAGGSAAGGAAGLAGGLLLAVAPGSDAPVTVAPVLSLIGAICGALGGAGAGAGLVAAEALALSARTTALVLGGAGGGLVAGTAAQALGEWTLGALFGIDVVVRGAIAGVMIGTGIGLAYAVATRGVVSGLAAPRGAQRLGVALITGLGGALAALVLALAGVPLVGGTVHAIAQASTGSRILLTPLGRMLGEPEFGPLTRCLMAMAEGGVFGLGLAFGLTRRR